MVKNNSNFILTLEKTFKDLKLNLDPSWNVSKCGNIKTNLNVSFYFYVFHSGCELNKPNTTGQTPLLLACEKGDDEIVELLLAQPRCEKRCRSLVDPLHTAVEYGHLAVAQKLIEGGWNCNQVSLKFLFYVFPFS